MRYRDRWHNSRHHVKKILKYPYRTRSFYATMRRERRHRRRVRLRGGPSFLSTKVGTMMLNCPFVPNTITYEQFDKIMKKMRKSLKVVHNMVSLKRVLTRDIQNGT